MAAGSKTHTRQFGTLIGAALAAAGVGLVLFRDAPAYFLTVYQNERCRPDEGVVAIREEVEECLFFYSTSDCRRGDGVSGVYYAGECVSYDILGTSPIHVVYDGSSRVTHWLSAYE